MEYQLSISHTITDIDSALWQELDQGRSFYLSYDWLHSIEGVLTPDSFYLIVSSSDTHQPLAALPCYLISNESTYLFFNVPKLLLSQESITTAGQFLSSEESSCLNELATASRLYQQALYPTLLCVAPYGYISAICYRSGLTANESQKITNFIINALNDLASTCGAKCIAFLYVPEQEDPFLRETLLEHNYLPMLLNANAVLPVEWKSFDEYLMTRTKKRRWTIRDDMRKFQSQGLTIRYDDVSALTEQFAPLQLNMQRKYGHRSDLLWAIRGYEQIKQNLASWARVFTVYKDTQPLAFALFYEKDGIYYCKQAGFDYEQLGNSSCYFNLVFYEPIRQAIARGIRSIHYGLESYETKLSRGCYLQKLWGYFSFPQGIPPQLADCIALENRAQHLRLASIQKKR